MITFLIGLFIGSSLGIIFTAILAMGKDKSECPVKTPYRRELRSSFDLFGRLGVKG